ncbi:hypothetical protein GQ43DRAFT_203522 [Delitschia confertaspora ATCC 74209]|uniref:Uncharacterized protein n=1 Tax=Delitschia confertaspora ATCC 74209 TaxID=1513339 RepID=A0A9P4JDN4_9PLEO|nr:hypothetical protein GQ43DRAFT_203522 [Delitschia confertaspora ATCC 74209]
MAAYHPSSSSSIALPANTNRLEFPKRPLPNGPCSHRDAIGPCGCNQFWDKDSADLHEASAEYRPSSARSTWCVCGHHACFHQHKAPPVADQRLLAPLAATTTTTTSANNRAHNKCDGSCLLYPGSQCRAHASRGSKQFGGELLPVGGSPGISFSRSRGSQMMPAQQYPRQSTPQGNTAPGFQQPRNGSSQISVSGLPRIPSVCMLNSHELRPVSDHQVKQIRHGYMSQTRESDNGLGLASFAAMMGPTDRPQSASATIPYDVGNAQAGPRSEPESASARANSAFQRRMRQSTPVNGSMGPSQDFARFLPHLDIGDTIPDTIHPEDLIQSATEVATPSNHSNTPDLRAVDQALEESKKLVETLAHLSNLDNNSGDTRPNSSNSGMTPGRMLTSALTKTPEQLQHALSSASPQAFQQIISYLKPLHNLLNSMPNVANTIQDLAVRLDTLERSSFSYNPPEDISHQLEHFDGRVLELEHRMDDHDKLHAAIDADQSSRDYAARQRSLAVNESFGSSCSAHSATSSALILAAMDRKEMETEFEGIKERLSTLESAAMPTMMDPWEVEVVLLPWGRELRGIWFTPDEPMHDGHRSVTQDTEEWTQARSVRSSSRSSVPFGSSENGWSSQAISDWADTTEEWLSPKACGTNNLVYKRLQSRGFIRNATLKCSNAGDIQMALSNTFNDLLEHLEYNPVTTGQDLDMLDQTIQSYPGLKAPFIPLRKVMKSSRLRFLTHAEMSSSALWTAQFLASGVLMRVSGGRRRLYVTQREAYLQQSTPYESSWTWQRLRELPRYTISCDPESQMEGSDQPHVPEADAKEPCWSFYPACDQPPLSVTSSFSSSHSAQLSIRPTDQTWRRSITPASILKNRAPISPISEFPNRRPNYARGRTASTSLVEQTTHASSKRRHNPSVDLTTQPQRSAQSFNGPISHSANISVSKLKRRRLSHSPSPHLNHEQRHAQISAWTNNTPRRSREPPSPFFSSHPELPRSNSDVMSRSQRSVNVVGKGTPFAYATPHSGPYMGAVGFGDFGEEGDTEVDDIDDGGSWHGVGGDDDDDDDDDDDNDLSGTNGSDFSDDNDDAGEGGFSDAIVGVEMAEMDEEGNFSGEDSGFGSEDDYDDAGGDDTGFGFEDQQAQFLYVEEGDDEGSDDE